MSFSREQPVQVTFRGVSLANDNKYQKSAIVINPRSDKYRYWEAFITLTIFLTCLLIPFQAFLDSEWLFFWVCSYLYDVLFFLDMLLHFRVGYFSKGSLVKDTALIRRSYLRDKFVLDLLTILPLDFLVFGFATHINSLQTLSLLRLNRTLRAHRIVSILGKLPYLVCSNMSLIEAFVVLLTPLIIRAKFSFASFPFGIIHALHSYIQTLMKLLLHYCYSSIK